MLAPQIFDEAVPEHYSVDDFQVFFQSEDQDDRFGNTEIGRRIAEVDERDRRVLEIALSDVQVYSKLWMLDEISRLGIKPGTTVLVLGGWCGVLPWLAELTNRNIVDSWISFDVDSHVCGLGRRIFGESVPNLFFVCHDIFDLDYRRLAADRQLLIVNTICEHIDEFSRWRSMLPHGVLTVLQSNNFRGCPDHVNCVDSSAELAEMASFDKQLFQGSLELSLFTRYMVIGHA